MAQSSLPFARARAKALAVSLAFAAFTSPLCGQERPVTGDAGAGIPTAEQAIARARALLKAPDAAGAAELATLLSDERLTIPADNSQLSGVPTSPATEARKALETLGSRALPALGNALTNGPERARARAAEAMGRIRDPAAIDSLVGALAATSRIVSLAVTEALVRIGTNALPAVREQVERAAPQEAVGGLWVLGQLRDAESSALFLRFLAADDERARMASASAFSRLGTSVVSRLLAGWEEADEAGRLHLVRALAHCRTPESCDQLVVTALGDPTPGLRLAALQSVAAMRDDRLPVMLVSALRDPDPDVRDAAATACRLIGSNEAAAIAGFLDHDSPVVWQGVSLALARAAPDAALPLLALLRNQSRPRDLQRRVAWVLMHMDDLTLSYEDSMRLWITAEDWRVINVFSEGIPGPLAEAATNRHPGARMGALSTMALNRLRGAEEYLIAALDDPDPGVVRTAQRGIAEYGYGLVLRLEQIVQRGSVRASRAAAGALEEIKYRPHTQAMAVEFNASRGAVGELMALGGMVPTHLLRRLERSQDVVESSRLAYDLSATLTAIVPDDRFGSDNVVVRNAFTGTNRTARLAAVNELTGRPGLLLALALDPDDAVAGAARGHLAQLPGNAAELLKACCLSGEHRLIDEAMGILRRLPPALLADFEWMLRIDDAALLDRVSRLFRERGHVPAATPDRVAMARALEDWPGLASLGDDAVPALRDAVARTPNAHLRPLVESLAVSTNLAMVNLLIDLYMLRSEQTATLTWPYVQQNRERLRPMLEAMLATGDILPATEAALLLKRLGFDGGDEELLFSAAAGDADALGANRTAATRFLLGEVRRPEPARRLRGIVWLTLLQRSQPVGEGALAEAALVRAYRNQLVTGTAPSKAEAALMLGAMGTNALAALDELLVLLGDETPLKAVGRGDDVYFNVRTPAAAAAYALARIGPEVTPVLLARWQDAARPEGERMQVAAALAGLADRRALQALDTIARTDPRLAVRVAAMQSMGQAAPEQSLRTLLDIAQGDRDQVARAIAIQALRSFDPTVRAQLLRWVHAEHQAETELILTVIRDLRTADAEATALQLLGYPSPGVRSQAARMLDRSKSDSAHRALVHLLSDVSLVVQWSAAEALEGVGIDAAPALVGELERTAAETGVAKRIATILRRITGENFGSDAIRWRAWLNARQRG